MLHRLVGEFKITPWFECEWVLVCLCGPKIVWRTFQGFQCSLTTLQFTFSGLAVSRICFSAMLHFFFRFSFKQCSASWIPCKSISSLSCLLYIYIHLSKSSIATQRNLFVYEGLNFGNCLIVKKRVNNVVWWMRMKCTVRAFAASVILLRGFHLSEVIYGT